MCTIVELVAVRCVAIAIASWRNYRRRAPRFETGCGTVLSANYDAKREPRYIPEGIYTMQSFVPCTGPV